MTAKNRVIVKCNICSKPYEVKLSYSKRTKYCSRKCFEVSHSTRMKGSNNPSYKHGHALRTKKSVEFESWAHMLQRCTNPSDKSWGRYGARGIKVCDRWFDFNLFYEDTGDKPSKQHQIERVNNDGDYCPENCIWATAAIQSRNRRSNIIIKFVGKTLCLTDWAKHFDIPYLDLYYCIIKHKLGLLASVKKIRSKN